MLRRALYRFQIYATVPLGAEPFGSVQVIQRLARSGHLPGLLYNVAEFYFRFRRLASCRVHTRRTSAESRKSVPIMSSRTLSPTVQRYWH